MEHMLYGSLNFKYWIPQHPNLNNFPLRHSTWKHQLLVVISVCTIMTLSYYGKGYYRRLRCNLLSYREDPYHSVFKLAQHNSVNHCLQNSNSWLLSFWGCLTLFFWVVSTLVFVNSLTSVPSRSSNIDCKSKYRFPRDLHLFR